MTLYVVGGYMRSGTSAMMRGLNDGGIPAVHRHSPEKVRDLYLAREFDGVDGPYELPISELLEPGFPDAVPDGSVVKALAFSIATMTPQPRGIRAVWMRRRAADRFRSMTDFFGYKPFPKRIAFVDSMGLAMARNRRDVEIAEVWYEDLMADPIGTFTRLRDFGFPIDPAVAAAAMDVAEYQRRNTERASRPTREFLMPSPSPGPLEMAQAQPGQF